MEIITARPHRLLPEIIARIGAETKQGKRCMLLVPAQFTLQAELEILAQLDIQGSFLIDVLSPGRLQSRVFERAGQPERTVFDARGKQMVLSAIIAEEQENLLVYGSAARSGAPGFTQQIATLIASFKRSHTTPEQVLEAAERLDEHHPARGKLIDAARLYAAYSARIAGQLADAEDVWQTLCERLPRSGVLTDQHVFVYGFDMITPTFAEQLVQMDALCASLTLAVETDKNGAPDGYLFAPVNASLDRLREIASAQGRPMQTIRIAAPLDAPDDIALMEKHLFALGAAPIEEAPTHIQLIAASGMRQSVHRVAAQMRTLAQAGEDSGQMVVVYPQESEYAPLIASILPQYGFTPYIAEKRSASAHPLCRFVLSALAVVSNGWRAADVMECVQSGMMGLDADACDALCAYIEGMDVRGEALKRPFRYAGLLGEEAVAQIEQSRETVCKPLIAFQRALGEAKDARQTVAAVIQLLEDVHAVETLERMRVELTEAGLDAEAQDCTQVWNRLMETLDQLHALLGETHANARIALSLLESGLAALSLSALPPADGAVICGAIGNVRTARAQTLFALGMNDTPSGQQASLFSPQEQTDVARETGAYLGMSAQEQAALAQLDILKALTNTRGRLIVAYALADDTGRALREGTAVQALKRLFPALATGEDAPEKERAAMLSAREPALEALSVVLSETADGKRKLTRRYGSAYAALSADDTGRGALYAVTKRLGSPAERKLPGDRARALYGRQIVSVSRLETFAQCPYRHFVQYGLAPAQTMTPGINRAELGTLYHEAAQRFTRAVMAEPSFPHLDVALCDRLMDEAAAPLIEAWRASPLGESARGAALAKRFGRVARRTGRNILTQYASGFRPLAMELVFGQNGVAPLMITLADGSQLALRGRIDRVDILDEGGLLRVVDYKSGGTRFDPTLIYWGLQLQLLLYLSAALAQMPGMQPAGLFYCRIDDPTVKTESRIQAEVEKQIAKRLALSGVSLADVRILRAQDARHAAMITKDGKPSGRYAKSMTDAAGMQAMTAFAQRKAASLAEAVYDGMIDDAPYQRGATNACASCDYAAICGFDPMRKPRRRLTTKGMEDLR